MARKEDYRRWQTLPALFFEQAERLADRPFLWVRRGGAYRPLTWGELDETVRRLAAGLRALGVARGDRVVLLSENRPEWCIADLAIMAAGGITVPAYTTNTAHDHNHILTDSGARGAIVSTAALAKRLLPAAIEAPDCGWVVSIEPLNRGQQAALRSLSWDDTLALGRDGQADEIAALVASLRRDETACFIYTSGTGGTPKGVMLSHGAILCNCMGAFDLLNELGLGDEVFLSFLPLSHAYEHTAGQFFPMSIGAQIYYATGVEQLLGNLAEVRPTIMTAVPRLYESMYQRILRGMEKQSPFKQRLFNLALRLGRKRYHDPRSLTLWERLLDLMADRLVRDKVRARFGGRLKAMVSGGAALNPDIGLFFTALGVPVLQGYGQTESAPVVSANPPGRVKMETVGPPLDSVEVRIAPDGEILVRGELVMQGYWRNEAATAAAVQDGWLHTGDVGEIDADGYIRITDRKKDILVLSGGDNVSPARVEGFLTLEPEIHQAMVFGDKQPHLVALLIPEDDFLVDFAKRHAVPARLEALHDHAELRRELSAAVERINKRLAPLERVRRFVVAREPFTVENEMLTPTMKIRRHKILAAYKDALEELYK
jgi:long-chain acyl-CoA synthetase